MNQRSMAKDLHLTVARSYDKGYSNERASTGSEGCGIVCKRKKEKEDRRKTVGIYIQDRSVVKDALTKRVEA